MTENLQPERAKSVTFSTTVLIQGDAEPTNTSWHTIIFYTQKMIKWNAHFLAHSKQFVTYLITVYIYIHIYTHTHIYIYTRTHTHTHIYTHTHTHTHIYIYIYIWSYWSEVSYGEVPVDKGAMYISVTLYCGYLIILWLFHLGISCTVFVLICTVVVLYCFVNCVCACVRVFCSVCVCVGVLVICILYSDRGFS
jgi:hypothetical protein